MKPHRISEINHALPLAAETATTAAGMRRESPASAAIPNHGPARPGGEAFAATIDAEDHNTVRSRTVADGTLRTLRPAERVSAAAALETGPGHDLSDGASPYEHVPRPRKDADQRDLAAAQRSACAGRTPTAPAAAATRRPHGARPTEPRARGSPMPSEPP